MTYTVRVHDRANHRDIEAMPFQNDKMAAMNAYSKWFEKYGGNDRYDVVIDMEEGGENDADVSSGDTADQLGDQDSGRRG